MKLERLADLRESRNWTQKYVASYLCVTQRSYGHYENGTRSLPLEHLIKLTELYDVSSDYILGTQIAITSWTPRGKNLGHGWSRRIYP